MLAMLRFDVKNVLIVLTVDVKNVLIVQGKALDWVLPFLVSQFHACSCILCKVHVQVLYIHVIIHVHVCSCGLMTDYSNLCLSSVPTDLSYM